MATQPHVLVANEPLAYRDLLTTELRRLRPELRVLQVDPADVDRLVARLHPSLVICSRPTATMRRHATAHIVLYPEGANRAVLAIQGTHRVLPNPQVADLLAGVDAAVGQGAPGGETSFTPDA
jgi:hypothetical protein